MSRQLSLMPDLVPPEKPPAPPAQPDKELPRPLKRMWKLHGWTRGKRCKRCQYLAMRDASFSAQALRCTVYDRPGNAPNVDPYWDGRWQACGLFKDRGYDYT